ncbi:Diphthamide biosynthesis protein 1 [Trichuris trichiura]|uniref:2-(3-amino-3-carboxypropyl)histidine synthase subunit 1 n=1 Tax=Trichuris trichiura TaxID=36087 RepID=A0A077Z9Y4_TRITR|nr:Diphthamide biosynthesis protein 1 [Trichuris trichiura]
MPKDASRSQTLEKRKQTMVVNVPREKSTSKEQRRIVSRIPVEILEDEKLKAAIANLPDTYNFEIFKTIWKIRQQNIKNVALQFPEGLLMFSCIIADILEEFANCNTVIMTDVAYGACCVDDFAVKAMDCQLLVHYGHSCLIPLNITCHAQVLYVFVDIKFSISHLVDTIRKNFSEKSKIALMSTVQFVSSLQAVRQELHEEYNIIIPQSKPLSPGETLGCTAAKLPPETDALLFIGDGRFHLEAAMIANPTVTAYKYDPYSRKCTIESYNHEVMQRTRRCAIDQAKCCHKFGIILGTLGRQGNCAIVDLLKRKLEEMKKEVFLFLLAEINPETLNIFSDIECWVQVACPRLSIDWGVMFSKPLLTPYELMVSLEQTQWETVYPMDYYANDSLGPWTNNHGKMMHKPRVTIQYTS